MQTIHLPEVGQVTHSDELVFSTMVEEIDAKFFPGSFRYVVGHQWEGGLGYIRLSARLTTLNPLTDFIGHARPEDIFPCSSQSALHTNMAQMKILFDDLSHGFRDHKSFTSKH